MPVALVICTKDRPDDLRRALGSVKIQTRLPDQVVIVDGSTTGATEEMVPQIRNLFVCDLVYRRTQPGLTRQRNVAISEINPEMEFAMFIDDDVELQQDYVEEVVIAFRRFPEALGVGAAILNQPKVTRKLDLLLGLDAKEGGRVLSNGVNTMRVLGEKEGPVEWLSGCSMSFRTSVFADCRFDERRPGNSLGEDVDFSMRVRSYGDLIWTDKTGLMHYVSQINRDNARRLGTQLIHHRLLLAHDRIGTVNTGSVLLGTTNLFLRTFFTAVLFRSTRRMQYAIGIGSGLIAGLFRRSTILTKEI